MNVDVSITDAAGNFVADLERRHFRLREDGAPQEIAHFVPTRAPIRVVLLVEANPAVFLIQREHLTAAYALLDALRPEDEAALVSYDRQTRPVVTFTRDKRRVQAGLDSLAGFGLGMAEMNLLDAVAATLDWLGPPPQRTAVIIIGTGLDSGSGTRWDGLQQRVGASQVTFFALAAGRLLRGGSKGKESATIADGFERAFAEADARLRELATASAGQAYFPESAKELDGIYREIAERLRNVYSLAYYPTNRRRDGRYREISVELVDTGSATPGYRVFARPGYFARRD